MAIINSRLRVNSKNTQPISTITDLENAIESAISYVSIATAGSVQDWTTISGSNSTLYPSGTKVYLLYNNGVKVSQGGSPLTWKDETSTLISDLKINTFISDKTRNKLYLKKSATQILELSTSSV